MLSVKGLAKQWVDLTQSLKPGAVYTTYIHPELTQKQVTDLQSMLGELDPSLSLSVDKDKVSISRKKKKRAATMRA